MLAGFNLHHQFFPRIMVDLLNLIGLAWLSSDEVPICCAATDEQFPVLCVHNRLYITKSRLEVGLVLPVEGGRDRGRGREPMADLPQNVSPWHGKSGERARRMRSGEEEGCQGHETAENTSQGKITG